MSGTMKLAIGSLFVGIVVLALKYLAFRVTGSVALYSDALESTVNVATAFTALFAIHVAQIPADHNHPFGHHKAEFFSAVLEGVMIIIASLLIIREAWGSLFDPTPLELPGLGMAINLLATALNGGWALVLIRQGRRRRSPALVADGRHLMTDVYTSVGVLIGVLLSVLTGWWILDPVMAFAVALNILWQGGQLVRESLSGLMDEALPEETLAQIREIIAAEAGGAVEAHDLRTRHAGPVNFIEFHLVVSGDTTVYAAHAICDRIERALEKVLGDTTKIQIHVEPENKARHDERDVEVILPEN